MPTRTVPARRAIRGYSLVEVLIASALLAGVLLSISSMFILGSQSVRSGRDLTLATTLANSAMEESLALPFELVWGITGATSTQPTMTWDTDQPTPAYVGAPQDVLLWSSIVDAWREEAQGLQDGRLTIRVDGIERLPTELQAGLAPYVDSIYLRITITVAWTEMGRRHRDVTFEGLAN